MLFDYISIFLGILKVLFYKIIFRNRIKFESVPKINFNFKFNLEPNTKLIIGKNFKARNNINIRNDVSGKISIGNNVFFNDNVSINCQKNIIIGENTMIGHNVILIDHDHDYKNDMTNFISDEIVIGKNAWIGANSIILKGTIIPDNTIIAAGTVVKGKYSDNGIKKIIYNKREIIVRKVL